MRVQFELGEAAVDFLDSLKEKLGLSTRTEAIKYALSILNWAIKEAQEGHVISTVDQEGGIIREFNMPGLDTLVEHAKKDKEEQKLPNQDQKSSAI